MTRLVNDPEIFAEQALAGFAASQTDRVLPVPGGLVRATETPRGHVAVVMGGGSGHFPAFAGWVGVGFGSGAAAGNIFASPSEAQILRVARAAESGGGILFVPINYAGDILHFGSAAERLRSEGIDVRLVPITDDIASGSTEDRASRRGIAGSFLAIKMIGAAAERGDSLDEVERIARAANEATRSFGVSLSGCTLPGADGPLFTVPPGRMAVGLGIHGEPGLSEVALGSGDDVADLLVDGLLAERAPEAGRRLAVLVNGLGSTEHDELFLVFRRVRERVEQAGMTLVAPVVGEQVTSLDMAGVSLSFAVLDDELEALWLAPADAATFSRGQASPRALRSADELPAVEGETRSVPPASVESRRAAADALLAFGAVHRRLAEEEKHLGDIDAVAGDGDHGAGMLRGAAAAEQAAADAAGLRAGLGTTLQWAGAAWSDVGGGTSGALWGAGLEAAGRVIGDEHAPDVPAAATAFRDAILERGHAEPGDKTMVDAIVPFVDALASGPWADAAAAATAAAERTADIVSRRGRSRIHGERSLGTPDAGAVSFALVVTTIGAALASRD